MTNLEIIKYLATNNPTRLAEFLDDIWCTAWNYGASAQRSEDGDILDSEIEFTESKWLEREATAFGFFHHCELKEWSKTINSPPTITAPYDNLSVTFPIKDADHMWNNNNKYDYEETK